MPLAGTFSGWKTFIFSLLYETIGFTNWASPFPWYWIFTCEKKKNYNISKSFNVPVLMHNMAIPNLNDWSGSEMKHISVLLLQISGVLGHLSRVKRLYPRIAS